jgi:hypothetical protein
VLLVHPSVAADVDRYGFVTFTALPNPSYIVFAWIVKFAVV